jgi:predicted nucleotidyltransferase
MKLRRSTDPGHKDPTVYAQLNAVLVDLVEGAKNVLGPNFLAAYLQGSFALGDPDLHSDVDFLIVTHDEVSPLEESQLQTMHEKFPDLDVDWAKHLEGSYVAKAALKRPDPARTPWLYVDNGSRMLERSEHDNTAVTRWVVREYGVILDGPDPKSLVDPVTAAELRAEVAAVIPEWAGKLRADPEGMNNAWRQPHTVLSYCRTLQTLDSGRVTSKLEAGRWALRTLDSEWSNLIQRALDDRPDPWRRARESSDPAIVERTWAFIDYVVAFANSQN